MSRSRKMTGKKTVKQVDARVSELSTQQDAVIKTLKQQQQALFYLLGGLTIISLIF